MTSELTIKETTRFLKIMVRIAVLAWVNHGAEITIEEATSCFGRGRLVVTGNIRTLQVLIKETIRCADLEKVPVSVKVRALAASL